MRNILIDYLYALPVTQTQSKEHVLNVKVFDTVHTSDTCKHEKFDLSTVVPAAMDA